MREITANNLADIAGDCRESLQNPRQRQILQNFIDHARAEANGN